MNEHSQRDRAPSKRRMPVEIAVDAMGSDKAPEAEIRGAILASRTLPDVRITLVGPEEIVKPKRSTPR